jgi:hypothetical protein
VPKERLVEVISRRVDPDHSAQQVRHVFGLRRSVQLILETVIVQNLVLIAAAVVT